MTDIENADVLVRRWTLIVTVLTWTFYIAPWLLVFALTLTGDSGWHKGWDAAALVWGFGILILLVHRLARRRLKQVCEAHPLIFLVRVREAFGGPA